MGVPGEQCWVLSPLPPAQHLDGDPLAGGGLPEAGSPWLWPCQVLPHALAAVLGVGAGSPWPCPAPAPSPTAAIPSSRSGSARAAGINQPGGTASAQPMRSGCCHGDAGRC